MKDKKRTVGITMAVILGCTAFFYLQTPTLIFQAKDDKLINYADTENAVKRFPNCTFLSFENGGHLMVGHSEEIKEAVFNFTKKQ